MFNSKEKKEKRAKESLEEFRDNFINVIEKNDKLILFTASSENIKKTSIILNLARLLIRDAHRVLIIDLNLRDAKLSEISKVELNRGFSDILVNDTPYENLITNDLYEKRLDMILSGRGLENADEFLKLAKLRNVFDSIRGKYDYVLVDSPENNTYMDANIISRSVDKVVVLSNKKDQKKNKLQASIDSLKNEDAEIAGIVMTDCK